MIARPRVATTLRVTDRLCMSVLGDQGLHGPSLVGPELVALHQFDQLVVAPRREEGAQAGGGPVEVAPDVLVGRKRQPRDADQTIRPCGGDVAGATQLAPVVGEPLDVRDLVRAVCFEEPFEPGGPRSLVRWRSDDHGHEFRDGVIDGRADGARRAVDVLQGGRDTLEERNRALRAENRLDARDQRDLGHGLLQTSNRWLRLPPKCVTPESRLEPPRVTAGLRHVRRRNSIVLSSDGRVQRMRLRYSDGRCPARIVDVTWPLHSKPVRARFCSQSSAGSGPGSPGSLRPRLATRVTRRRRSAAAVSLQSG